MHICVVSLLGYRIDELNIQWRDCGLANFEYFDVSGFSVSLTEKK